MSENISRDKYLTVRELAFYLDIKPATVYKWTCQGKLRSVKPFGGGRSYFSLTQVLAAFEQADTQTKVQKKIHQLKTGGAI